MEETITPMGNHHVLYGTHLLEYPITQLNSQVRFGPPTNVQPLTPGDGTEIFVSGIPPDHELGHIFDLFSCKGIIHTARFIISFR